MNKWIMDLDMDNEMELFGKWLMDQTYGLNKKEKNGLKAIMIKFPQPNQLSSNQLGSSNSTWISKINSRNERNDF